jgi:threonine dehydratase
MKMKTMFLAAAIVCALAACKKDVAPTDATVPADTAAVDTAVPATDPAVVAPDATLTADGTGVKECDDYLTKYTACLNDKVPEASRAAMQQGIDQMRASWKEAAATPAGKAGMAQACTAAADGAKASMKAFGCEM